MFITVLRFRYAVELKIFYSLNTALVRLNLKNISNRNVPCIIVVLWKQAQQEVGQHWLIDSYIAAYIQVQYRVTGVDPTGLTVARGVGRCPQGSPRALASAGRRRGKRSNLCGGARRRDGYRVCGTCDGAAGPRQAQDHVGAIIERLKGWNQVAPMDPNEGGQEQLGWQLAGQVNARIVPGQRRHRNMQGILKFCDNGVN